MKYNRLIFEWILISWRTSWDMSTIAWSGVGNKFMFFPPTIPSWWDMRWDEMYYEYEGEDVLSIWAFHNSNLISCVNRNLHYFQLELDEINLHCSGVVNQSSYPQTNQPLYSASSWWLYNSVARTFFRSRCQLICGFGRNNTRISSI